MKYTEKEFAEYPELMNKEQMRIACHISKRTALYLLKSGLVPSINTGKKTRCYLIKKRDIIDFMNNRQVNPHRYLPPEKWYHPSPEEKNNYTIRILPNTPTNSPLFRQFFMEKLVNYPMVLSREDVCEFTGYDYRTVTRWVRTDKCYGYYIKHKTMIPKEKLVEWMIGNEFNSINRKSREHVSLLWEFDLYSKSK